MIHQNDARLASDVAVSENSITIRGTRLLLDELVDARQLLEENALRLRATMAAAQPFEHLTLDGLFNSQLLELVHEEFDVYAARPWSRQLSKYEDTFRSAPGSRLGPAAQLYFWLVNSGPFTAFLSAISGVSTLIPDPQLIGGGMHETRNGGHFGVHRDFEVHVDNGLSNAMVLITYLNKDWPASYQGFLELWDAKREQCVQKVPPDFGLSLLMRHGPSSYHGYLAPLNAPPGRTRRSVASYYYVNKDAANQVASTMSKFLFTTKGDLAMSFIKQFVPPILWKGVKKLKR
jgi:hypothetical protein